MDQYTTLSQIIDGRIATVTLTKPDRRNALDDVMIRELTDVFGQLNRNASVRVVVLTGEGGAFCAGMDLAYLQRLSTLTHEEHLEDARNLQRMLHAIHTLKKSVIAMVNGPALGGGCGLAACCDYVYASKEKAKIGAPEVRLGFVPAVILVYLIHRMGEASAKEFVLRGELLSAERAQQKGIVTEVVEGAALRQSVYDFAETLCSTTSPSSVALTKDLFSRFHEMNEREALEYAANLNALARKTADFQKGITSFLKKETPKW
jgi:methylglutaconyl-CoA hydratase